MMLRSFQRLCRWLSKKLGQPAYPINNAVLIKTESATSPRAFLENPRILILKLDHIGDFILAMRAIQQLRTAWPQAFITLVCGSWNVDLALKSALFDRVVQFDFFTERSFEVPIISRARLKAIEELNLGAFDLAIDLRYEQDTRSLLDYVKTTYRAGYYAQDLKHSLDVELLRVEQYRKHARKPPPMHAEERLMLLAEAVIATFRRSRSTPIGKFPEVEKVAHGLPNRFVVVAPHAGKSSCQWALANFMILANQIIGSTDLDIVLIGHERDRPEMYELMQSLPTTRYVDRIGTALSDLPTLILRSKLFIGNNTGTTHLAAQLGIPTICIFSGAFDWRIWQPVGADVTVLRTNPQCSPCGLASANDCQYGLQCLTNISSTDVFKVVSEKLIQTARTAQIIPMTAASPRRNHEISG